MSEEKDIQLLEREVRHLESLVRQETARSRSNTRWTLVVTGSLGLILLGFVAVNYVKLSREWTKENFSRSLEDEMRELSPAAMRELNTLGEEIVPVYLQEFKEQFAAMVPEISRRMENEVNELSQQILVDVSHRLDETQERILAKTERSLVESYPTLRDPVERELISRKFHEICDESVTRVIGRFTSRFGADVEKVQQTLLTFDLSDSEESTFELQKKFIHHWLMLLDQEIMEL